MHLKKYPGITSAPALERRFPKVFTVFVIENVCTSGMSIMLMMYHTEKDNEFNTEKY